MTKKEIQAWLKKHEITNYTIDDNLTVHVYTHVSLANKNLTELPFAFGNILGNFDVVDNKLTSFHNFPKKCLSIMASNNKFINTDGLSSCDVIGSVLLYECSKFQKFTEFPNSFNALYLDTDYVQEKYQKNFLIFKNYIDSNQILNLTKDVTDKIMLHNSLNKELKQKPISSKIKI